MRQSEWRRRWGIAAVQTFDGQVGASGDDGDSNATFSSVRTTSAIGEAQAGNLWDTFALIDPVTIPAGATIITAYLTVEAQDSTEDGAGVKSNISMNDEDDPAAPTTAIGHQGLNRTTASTAWDDEDFVVDTPTNSPDISAVVQEIVDRPGWISGQAMLVLWDDDGSVADPDSYYLMHTYDGDTSKAIKLHVEYTT